MDSNNFKNLICTRQKWVQISKENNFDFDSILPGIYSDPSHFIYEILQNAEDAGAKEISFSLFDDRLEIVHDGKDFNFKDLDGITGIGISTKKDKINAIGKFGIGFKSVFAVTKTPIIHSGSYHFTIEDFVIPSSIASNGIKETQIILPFNNSSRTKEEVFKIVSQKVESIGLKTLLFLKNIEEIKWQTPEKSGHYYKESKGVNNFENVHKISIISKIEQEEYFEEFLVIQKPIKIDSSTLKVEVAYRVEKDDSGKDDIVKENESELIVFFPTGKVTNLNFLIQGPYKTTPNRENIPLEDEQNQYLIKETANLVAESIPIIKELDLLNISFLEVLPIEQKYSNEIIYSSIYKEVKKKLLSEEAFLPTSKSNFTISHSALLARGKELVEFLNNDDIKILFGKEYWMDTNITDDRNRELRNYLKNELDIKEVDFDDFAATITKEFIEKKHDNWLIEFYSKLLDHRSLWTKKDNTSRNAVNLRQKPIIRLADDSHIDPCDQNNKIQVYLPADTKSKYRTVKITLTRDENSLKFLTDLGVTKPDIFAEIREFVIPKYANPEPNVDIEEYFEDFEKLLTAFQKDDPDKKKGLIIDLKNLYIIHSTNSITGINGFRQPQDVYLKIEELIEYFKEYNFVFFVSDELHQRFSGNEDSFLVFLADIGCENKPRRKQIEPSLSHEEKEKLRDRGYTREIHTIDYDYEGLENFLTDLTKKRSGILWNFLLKSLEFCDKWARDNFFKGEYRWFYYNSYYKKYDSKFLKTLKNTNWIFDGNGNFVLPNQITLSGINDCYVKDNDNVEKLISILGFQIDEIKIIEEKTGGKFIPKEEVKEYLKWKEEQSKKENNEESEEDESWTSKVEAESVEPIVKEIEPQIIETPDYRGQRPNKPPPQEPNEETELFYQEKFKKERSTKKIKAIGEWGEQHVLKYLRRRFVEEPDVEIIWLNKKGEVGKGYDFSIVSEGREIEYIEVKSKIDEEPQLVEITGTQWEFARKLYNENEGDKYNIYVVSNACSENAKIGIIKNPTKLWKEGRLYAHPVCFKL